MRHLSIDIETYSPEPLRRAGLYRYAQHPDFQILLFACSLDGQPVQTVDLTKPGACIPPRLAFLLFDPTCIKHAFNAAFEWYCLSRCFHLNDTQAAAWLPQWRDTQLHASYCGYPLSLDAAGKALGLSENQQKLSAGKALIRYFCKPCQATRSNGGRLRNLPCHDPDKWALFVQYNAQDVVTEMEIGRRLSNFPVPEDVQRQWELDQTINLRGVAADLELLDGAVWCGETARRALLEEAAQISGLPNPNSVPQLLQWIQNETGTEWTDMRKDTVADRLAQGVASPGAKRMLEIRQELGKTSTKKYDALEASVCADGRVRGLLQFYGANRTGREAGRLVQVQNLPHDVIPMEAFARELVKKRQADALRFVYGSVPFALSALIRTAFIAAPGMTFIDADFSAIEARVLAWLAGESWVLEVFRGHGKIYEATASQMFGIPLESIKKGSPEYAYRAKGKVATLALGYQGGTGALITMGALRSGLTEQELPDIVFRWRKSNPAIVQFWYDVERAAMNAVTQGVPATIRCVTLQREIDPPNGLDFLTIQLPSGRKLYYAQPQTGKNRFGRDSLCYQGMSQSGKKWETIETYGGKLVENITQAVARDCLFYAMERLTAAGYRIVFDVHDEVVIEIPEKNADSEAVVQILSQPPPWAPDLPLRADGWVGPYFRKD